MKKHFAILILATLPCAAQTLKLYDNFDHKFIDPSKWAYAFCFSSNGLELECVREIHSWNSVSPGCKQTEPNPSRFPSPPPIPGTRQCQSEVMTRNRRRRLVDDVRR
jgi:hypothetical protein